MKNFFSRLEAWYKIHQRDLPWRKTRDPYLIWISEIIFQQTRINQGFEYYQRFVEAFPDVMTLAAADEAKVLKLWQGLGYYSRARNIHKAANIIVEKHQGVFPKHFDDIRKLPGIGDYTAAAIASFAFLQVFPVVDGNVIRFISRLYGLNTLFTTDASKKELYMLLNKLIDPKKPDIFNNAIMEFGALQCKPATPDCEACIFKSDCVAFKKKLVQELPLKVKKKVNPILYLNYLVCIANEEQGKASWLQKRSHKGIWHNLYDFPCHESEGKLSFKQLEQLSFFKEITSNHAYRHINSSTEYVHKLTHKTFYAYFHVLEFEKGVTIVLEGFEKCLLDNLHTFPVSRLMEIYLEEEGLGRIIIKNN
ncbi:MAG: A/G-specific adenine glycosylase [Bacteroidota bacterium]